MPYEVIRFEIEEKKIKIYFEKNTDLIELFRALNTFTEIPAILITRVLLITKTKTYRRYNDITPYIERRKYIELEHYIQTRLNEKNYEETSILNRINTMPLTKEQAMIEITTKNKIKKIKPKRIKTREETINQIIKEFKDSN